MRCGWMRRKAPEGAGNEDCCPARTHERKAAVFPEVHTGDGLRILDLPGV